MKIKMEPNWITIVLKKESLQHKLIDNFIKKQFPNILTFSTTTYVLYNSAQKSKKKLFLEWILSAFFKNDKENILRYKRYFETNFKKPLKIELENSSGSELQKITITKITKSRFKLDLSECVESVKNYFKLIFKSSNIIENNKRCIIELVIDSQITLTIFKKLVESKKVLRFNIEYIIKNQRENGFKKEYKYNINIKSEPINRYYEVLNCKPTDTISDIKRSYKRLVKQYHPDMVYGQEKRVIDSYTKKFMQIQEAYEKLIKHQQVA